MERPGGAANPSNLQVSDTRNGVELRWNAPEPARDGDKAHYYAVYRYSDNEKPRLLAACYEGQTRALDRTALRNRRYTYAITALDRLHNESEAVLASIMVRSTVRASKNNFRILSNLLPVSLPIVSKTKQPCPCQSI